jgi:two-component system sensor histidine kinase ChvG
LILSMAPDTVLQTPDTDRFQLRWSRKLSLTSRILAVNLFALALMASGLFFLDSYRTRLVAERQAAAESQVKLLATSLAAMSDEEDAATLANFARTEKLRVRLYGADGAKTYDSNSSDWADLSAYRSGKRAVAQDGCPLDGSGIRFYRRSTRS